MSEAEQALRQAHVAGSPDGEPATPQSGPLAGQRPATVEQGEQGADCAEGSRPPGPAEDGADEQALQGDVEALVAVAAQRDEYLALAQRTQADFENYRKRMSRESSQALGRGVAKLAKELLPALDSLDRALEGAAQDDPLLEGVRLVRAELHTALARAGVESFAPLGERFDPAQHEAVVQKPAAGAASGTVSEVYQAGYRMGESIIRAARVAVAA